MLGKSGLGLSYLEAIPSFGDCSWIYGPRNESQGYLSTPHVLQKLSNSVAFLQISC